MTRDNCANRVFAPAQKDVGLASRALGRLAVALVAALCGTLALRAEAQPSYSPVVITAPLVDLVDENSVSLQTGKIHFSVPALKLGDVSFSTYTVNDKFYRASDNNYGYIVECQNESALGSYGGTSECVSNQGVTVEAVYGEERAPFYLGTNGLYTSPAFDGSTYVDNGSTCTWTKRDGTQIVFVAFHAPNDPNCLSNNISEIIHPDGRIETYYYYGTLSTAINYTPSPLLAIATNSGYLLKYNYPGTPNWGAESSVVAINRAFEACDPTALSCTLTQSWPTATLSWTSTSFTITDGANRTYVFGLDSWYRVISYQPPQATTPVYFYTLCTLQNDGHTMTNCWGFTYYPSVGPGIFDPTPYMWDLVETVTRNGQTWSYGEDFQPNSPPGWSVWSHSVVTPLGTQMLASGNATPGLESYYGPLDNVTHYDGTVDHFEHKLRNYLYSQQSPGGILTQYQYDITKGSLTTITKNPVSGSALSPTTENAAYPTPPCGSIVTCYKPISVTDANGNTVVYTYDPTHGGVVTETDPAVNTPAGSGIQPQKRYTYGQKNAQYLSSSGVLTTDPHPIWVLMTESFCRKGPAVSPPQLPGAGCVLANDEVVTTYLYGTGSGADNLIVRGKSVAADGQTLQTCYGHDMQGNKIWETSPNAQPSSCPSY